VASKEAPLGSTAESSEPLLTAEQVGAQLQQQPREVLKKARSGELAVERLGGRSVRFRPADVERYIRRHRVPDTAYAEIASVLVAEAERAAP
jgi:excisionase family DNA binding protein